MLTTSFPSYVLRRSLRARKLNITIRPDKTVVVTRPRWMSEGFASAFVEKSRAWIERKFSEIDKGKRAYLPHGSPSEYRALKQEAFQRIRSRLEYFNQSYQFKFNRVTIRNPRTRWGSCSRKGNLNFSYRLISLPAELADYIIVHELCHLSEFNHSKRFWDLVEQSIPDHRDRRKLLRGVLS